MTATKTAEWTEVRRATWSEFSTAPNGSSSGTDYYTAIWTRRTWPQDGSSYAGHTYERKEIWIGPTPDYMHVLVSLSESHVSAPDAAKAETPAPAELVLPKPQDHLPKQAHRPARKPGTAIQRAIAAYRNRSVLTVDGFLASLGADPDTTRRYRSSLGRKVAQAYRAATGQEPTRAGWAVAHHRLIPVYAYDRQQAALLAEVARGYKPTAHLIGA
ncbi:hypothetical protein [Actinocrinis sp.]|uniref:hypothetical protein n=1 Tax=Actinocrinis sp. TaxID=1920516 RepID=UPI002D275634|nr:hypothetical protein [Actinocrinis sp.]HZP49651.1 hypothetical protein [Actinocrinis sp.]